MINPNKKNFLFLFLSLSIFLPLYKNSANALDIKKHNNDTSHCFIYEQVDASYIGLTGIKNFVSKGKTLAGNFDQTKTLLDMNVTLKSTGNFYFKKDFGIIWNIKTPLKAQYIITKDFFCSKIQDKLDKKKFSDEPRFNEIKESIDAILKNDYTSLFENFDVYKANYSVENEEERLRCMMTLKACPTNSCTQVTLIPKNKEIKEFIDNIYLYLSFDYPNDINVYITYKNGDEINLDLSSDDTLSKKEIKDEEFICK